MDPFTTRRQFAKGLLSIGAALGLASQVKGGSSDTCQELSSFEKALAWDRSKIYFWIDGFQEARSGLPSRAYMAVLLVNEQTPSRYIDTVVLTDESKNIVYSQYFTPQDKMSDGNLPYITINNLDLKGSRYLFYIQLQDNGTTRRYRFVFAGTDLQRTRLKGPQLPATVRFALEKTFDGYVSTPYIYRKRISSLPHLVRAEWQKLSNDGFFAMKVYFMHEDIDPLHYMRYFIVTDPVGRVLGMKERPAPAKKLKDLNKSSEAPLALPPAIEYELVTNLTSKEQETWGLTKTQTASVNDCPYVMVFCDDVSESLSKTTLWLT